MRMWTQGDRSEVGLKPANKAQASKPHKQVDEETDTEGRQDADDFYIFLYDEEDKTMKQSVLKSNRGRGRGYEKSIAC